MTARCSAGHRKIRLACGDDARGRDYDFDLAKPGDLLDFECFPDLTQAEVDAAVAALKANDDLAPALRLIVPTPAGRSR